MKGLQVRHPRQVLRRERGKIDFERRSTYVIFVSTLKSKFIPMYSYTHSSPLSLATSHIPTQILNARITQGKNVRTQREQEAKGDHVDGFVQ